MEVRHPQVTDSWKVGSLVLLVIMGALGTGAAMLTGLLIYVIVDSSIQHDIEIRNREEVDLPE